MSMKMELTNQNSPKTRKFEVETLATTRCYNGVDNPWGWSLCKEIKKNVILYYSESTSSGALPVWIQWVKQKLDPELLCSGKGKSELTKSTGIGVGSCDYIRLRVLNYLKSAGIGIGKACAITIDQLWKDNSLISSGTAELTVWTLLLIQWSSGLNTWGNNIMKSVDGGHGICWMYTVILHYYAPYQRARTMRTMIWKVTYASQERVFKNNELRSRGPHPHGFWS